MLQWRWSRTSFYKRSLENYFLNMGGVNTRHMPQSHGVHNEVYIMGDNAAQLLA